MWAKSQEKFSYNESWHDGLCTDASKFFRSFLRGTEDEEGEHEASKSKTAPREFAFEFREDGTPILTGEEFGKSMAHSRRQEVLRQYITIHYCT